MLAVVSNCHHGSVNEAVIDGPAMSCLCTSVWGCVFNVTILLGSEDDCGAKKKETVPEREGRK